MRLIEEAERLLKETEAESRSEVALERARERQAQRAQERLAAIQVAEREAEREAARIEAARYLAAGVMFVTLVPELLGFLASTYRHE